MRDHVTCSIKANKLYAQNIVSNDLNSSLISHKFMSACGLTVIKSETSLSYVNNYHLNMSQVNTKYNLLKYC